MKLKINNISIQTANNGTVKFILSVDATSNGAVRSVLENSRKLLKQDGVIICELTKAEKDRTLQQNALMWSLLTIYAKTLNGGRTGDYTPEKLYYSMLEHYGVASFVAVPDVCIKDLKRSYRAIRIIDEIIIERNGKKTTGKMVKCIVGSSKYNTKEMTNLIEGIFDDLAALGADYGGEVTELYQEWKAGDKKQ